MRLCEASPTLLQFSSQVHRRCPTSCIRKTLIMHVRESRTTCTRERCSSSFPAICSRMRFIGELNIRAGMQHLLYIGEFLLVRKAGWGLGLRSRRPNNGVVGALALRYSSKRAVWTKGFLLARNQGEICMALQTDSSTADSKTMHAHAQQDRARIHISWCAPTST